MKKNTIYPFSLLLTALLMSCSILAQVGINTTDPKGILDFNSTTYGVVYPNVALNATDDPDPVVNPQGGPIVEGTVVYNTNTTNLGTTTDVYPGIYVWNGSEWVVHYKKRQSELHEQTSSLRTEADFPGEWQDVPGLGISDTKTFTAKYSGLYRIEVKTNFAGGQTDTNDEIFVSQAKGQFRFLFDGNPNYFETTAFSAYTSYINGGTHYEGIWKESYKTVYLNLVAGTTYPFSLSFDAYDAPGFVANGTTSIPSFNDLVNEDFTLYTTPMIVQTINSTGCGGGGGGNSSTNGWVIDTGTCSGCAGNSLFIDANGNGCIQDATAELSFIPTINSVDINFDYEFSDKNTADDSFKAYVYDETNGVQLGGDLVSLVNTSGDASYTGTIAVVAGTNYTLRFEYKSNGKANNASVDNVVISEPSGPITTVYEGRGYVGNEINCQVEFTYIGE